MKTKEAIMAFSQSEKIKAGLIWISQVLELLSSVPENERKGGDRMANALINMVCHEVKLAWAVVGGDQWNEIESLLDKAGIMVQSGVGHEAMIHISKALSNVTSIGQRSMSYLKEASLL
jgi:hypothetical protein